MVTPDAAEVIRVTLVRLGSVTHAFDQTRHFAELSFRLTLLNDAGVPSLSTIMRIQ